MKAIILAGGLGSRLGNLTESIPKPMVKIDNKPIIYHIMSSFSKYGINDFIIALGYKSEVIKDYFLNFKERNSNFNINLNSGKIKYFNDIPNNWNISLVDTGINTMTGGRVKKLQEYINEENFLLTYGDGLCNVNIKKLIDFHKAHGKAATVTAVRPNARFGELLIEGDTVKSFKEKPQTDKGRINGGYFVFNKTFFDYINDDDHTVLEASPLEKATEEDELRAFKHDGFWQCMDTPRDKDLLEQLSKSSKKYPWLL
jgi:glucose-1-phosphate cytidylyltransferase|tara:strand:- start:7 stop:777 length:771 start_codon:yes stop_codon:yes gene_type:complete